MHRKIPHNFFARVQATQTPTLFDRCEGRAKSAEWLQETLVNPKTVVLGFMKNDIAMLISPEAAAALAAPLPEGAKKPRPPKPIGVASVPPKPLVGDAESSEIYLLGIDKTNEIPYFARALHEAEVAAMDKAFGNATTQLFNLRNIYASLDPAVAAVIAQGKSLVEWHQSALFCGYCGAKTVSKAGGRSRHCPACDKSNYPRTNPVAIMMVLSPDGASCALGQTNGRHVGNLYSCLAGFVDQGESLENAVCREVFEESGLLLDPRFLRYHSSQPWPYPFQLMLGMVGVASSTDIRFDPEEMHDVKWFPRDLVAKALRSESDDLQVPPSVAIANVMMQSWVDGELDDLIEEARKSVGLTGGSKM